MTEQAINDDDLIDENEASGLTGGAVKPGTFQQWRWNGRGGPRWYKFGHKVRYRRSDVRAWIESQARIPAATQIANAERASA